MLSVLRGFVRSQRPLSSVYKVAEQLRLLGSKCSFKGYRSLTYLGFGSTAVYTSYCVNKNQADLKIANNLKDFSALLWIVAGISLLRLKKKPAAVLAVLTVSPNGEINDSISLTTASSHAEASRRSVMHDHDYREKSAPPTPKPMSSKASVPSSSAPATKNNVHLSKFNGPIYNAIYDCTVNRLYELPEGNLPKKYELEMVEKVKAISALMKDEKINKEAINKAMYKLSHNQIAEKDIPRTLRFIKVSESYVNTCQKLQKDALKYFKH